MAVVVVESPAKAKTINKYLGSDFVVLASVGHVRDLPSKKGAVDPNNDFQMNWEVDGNKQKNIKAIADALADQNKLILATDPDREGEAISWHLLEVLQKRRAVKKSTSVERVVFNAITKDSVLEAMRNPRKIDMPLVEAYMARRALDYLVGFGLSPVLWRTGLGGRSAGRVQSVSLKLLVEREMQIEAFNSEEYWSIETLFEEESKETLTAKLSLFDNKKIEKMTIRSEQETTNICATIKDTAFTVGSINSTPKNRNPAPPFMTSTLQQEASRKLGLGTKETMMTAQRLYEAGLITYMRTDGIDMAPEATNNVRVLIQEKYGNNYAPQSPRIYKNASKNAQEAHECIRPTDINLIPSKLPELDKIQVGLYKLIWNRTVSSQMESAKFEATSVDIINKEKSTSLRASGQVMLFDGFLKIYAEGRDDEKNSDEESRLPSLTKGQNLNLKKITPTQHFTQPPPRYSEAALVKRMEELGIGRPSTYASTVTTLLDREYARKEKNRLVPEDKGRLVTIFLNNYFNKYLEYDYTAGLEKNLDKVSAGKANWKQILTDFWNEFAKTIETTADLRITEILEKLNEVLEPHIFPSVEDGTDPRLCKTCNEGRLSMRTSRSGSAFIGCSNYPDCRYTRPLSSQNRDQKSETLEEKVLGQDPENKANSVTLKNGRFGPYVQLGDQVDPKVKPPRSSIPKGMDIETVDLDKALKLLALPRQIGPHPTDGVLIEAAIGRYGPYLKHGRIYANLTDPEEILTIGMNRAVEILEEKIKSAGSYSVAKSLRELGEHPDSGMIDVMDGKYGPYVKWKKINATLPKGTSPENITLEEAIQLINDKVTKQKKPSARKKKK
ncbi:MAG: type I DNA topoisomerase [Paracoccaceae bacterium]|nr:type I DNA topoisomerase [Paracoccaceae bacterium]